MKSTILNLFLFFGTVCGIPIAIAEYNLQQNISATNHLASNKATTVSSMCHKLDSLQNLKTKINEIVESRLEANYKVLENEKAEIIRVSLCVDSALAGGDMENCSIDSINIVN